MSKDSFKVKKGLTLTPIDPADITNPQPGDLISDSTDDNKIKKYDETSAEWTAVGGSAGIGGNLMSDFENLTPTVSNVTSATDTVTFLPIDDNNKSIKATWAGSVGSIQYQVALDSSLQEIQGTVSVWLRTSLSDIQISSVQDGVKISTLNVTGNNKWRQYEIPMVLGGSNVGFVVESLTAQTGDVFIDEVFVGLTPSSYAFDIAQSELIGSAEYPHTTNCSWTTSSNGTFPADTDCPTPILQGDAKAPSTKIPGITFSTLKPGTYKVVLHNIFSDALANARVNATIYDGTNFFGSGGAKSSTTSGQITNVIGDITYTETQTNVTFQPYVYRDGGNALIVNNAQGINSPAPYKISVYYYPPKSTIVTQVQTLDVNTANHFSARVEAASSITSENGLDWLDTCTYNASLGTVCTFQSGIFNETPSCVATPFNNAGNDNTTKIVAGQTDNTKVTVEALTGGTRVAVGFHLHCSKQGADVNKSAMIVGNFEQIKSGEMTIVEATGNVGTGIGSGIDIPFTNETTDNKNAWNGTVFTAPEDGYYIVDGSVFLTSNVQFAIFATKNGSNFRQINQVVLSNVHQFDTTIYLSEGETFSVRASAAATVNNNPTYHYITIKKSPDLESLVKNLNDNKNVKCQTKYLSAGVSSTGIMSDLTFSNLSIGKKYKLSFNLSVSHSDSANNFKDIRVVMDNGATSLYSLRKSITTTFYNDQFFYSRYFDATDTSLTFNTDILAFLNINDARNGSNATYAEICELPDYYIETDEW